MFKSTYRFTNRPKKSHIAGVLAWVSLSVIMSLLWGYHRHNRAWLETEEQNMPTNIVILHGLYMHGVVMKPLSEKLRNLGHQTKIVTYNSLNIEQETLFSTIDAALKPNCRNILVGHSLGGIVIKNYLSSRQPNVHDISHVVAIGSPLRGASIVTRIKHLGLGKMLGNSPEFGLNEHQDRWVFPQPLGSIAGTVPIGARPILMKDITTQSDGTVTVEETTIDGMQDHLLINHSHTSLIYNQQVAEQIDHFIQHDQFKH